MPRMATEPLLKVTLNLYEADVVWLQRTFGQGWSTAIRTALREYILEWKERNDV